MQVTFTACWVRRSGENPVKNTSLNHYVHPLHTPLIKSLSHIYAQLVTENSTEITIIPHAQNTTALQPNVFFIGIRRLLVTKTGRSPFPTVNIAHLRQECHNSKIWHIRVIGTERNVCRCTFNRYSVITQFAKLAAGEQLCRR